MDQNTEESISSSGPRRSGRERRQAESVYADAKAAAAAANAAESSTSTRKKRKPEDAAVEDNPDVESDAESVDSSDEEEEIPQYDIPTGTIVRKLPTNYHNRWAQYNAGSFDRSEYKSIDGNKMFYYNNWQNQNRYELTYGADVSLRKGQTALVKNHGQKAITLDCKFAIDSRLSQVPYHQEKMMPYYDYFAAGVQACRELESFSISNYFLPPSPWLGNSILPVLSVNRGLETLELSNCSLSSDDFLSLSNWIAGNSTLSSVNFSRNNIESVDAVKSLAKAIRKHPSIRHVNLAYCSLGNGDIQVLNKILSSCDSCHSLEIGHEEFPSNCVAAVVEFIGDNKSLKSFSLTGATVDKGTKKRINDSLSRNKSIQSFSLRSNKLQLPSIIRNSKKTTKALSRLTQLDMSSNKLSVQGAKMLASFIEKPECNLVTLILSNNHLTTKGANALLPAVKKNATLKVLDLSCNWLSDALAPVLVDLLKGNVKLCTLDLTGNKSLRTHQRVRSTTRRWGFDLVEAGCGKIVNEALFDTTSLAALLDSNHTCIVKMKNGNRGDLYEDTIRKINSLQVSESKKIQYKLILSRTVGEKKNLLDHHMLDELPLELLPRLLEFVQHEFGYNGYGKEVMPSEMPSHLEKGKTSYWNGLTRNYVRDPKDERLSRLYNVIVASQSLPLLFARGPGEVTSVSVKKKKVAQAEVKAKKSKPRKRRKFGDDDDDDEAWLPKGAKTTRGKWKRNWRTGEEEYILPSNY